MAGRKIAKIICLIIALLMVAGVFVLGFTTTDVGGGVQTSPPVEEETPDGDDEEETPGGDDEEETPEEGQRYSVTYKSFGFTSSFVFCDVTEYAYAGRMITAEIGIADTILETPGVIDSVFLLDSDTGEILIDNVPLVGSVYMFQMPGRNVCLLIMGSEEINPDSEYYTVYTDTLYDCSNYPEVVQVYRVTPSVTESRQAILLIRVTPVTGYEITLRIDNDITGEEIALIEIGADKSGGGGWGYERYLNNILVVFNMHSDVSVTLYISD